MDSRACFWFSSLREQYNLRCYHPYFCSAAAGLRVEPGAFATSGLDDPSELRIYTQARVHLFTLRADAPLLFQPPKPEGYFNLYPGFYPWRSPPSSYWYTKR
jgi:hypothetical protein